MAVSPLTFAAPAEERLANTNPLLLPPSPVELNLLLEPTGKRSRPQWLAVIGGSLAFHLLFFFVAIQLPSFVSSDQLERRVIVKRTPLYLPPDVLTQKAPNRHKVSDNIDLASLLASQEAQAHKASPQSSTKHFELPKLPTPPKQTAQANPQILPEPPKVALNQMITSPPPGAVNGIGVPAPPPPAPVQKPFQSIGADVPPNPRPTIVPPKANVQEAMKGIERSGNSSRLIISDDSLSQPSPPMPGAARQPGAEHAAVELQSDPEGADFKEYLTRILAIVRANWGHVIPESARMGTLRGRTVMEFIINRDGSIPKLVTAQSSGSDPLDRAAIAGLSMSNPLPALPADYKGFQVRLAFTFSYNLPTQ
ncbi:MAG TPA: TonB family protein [Bryobacteraceae bacterium]|nr:TonB family protein [Bryobacteraceae bacterium]